MCRVGFSEKDVKGLLFSIKVIKDIDNVTNHCASDCKRYLGSIWGKGVLIESVFNELYKRYPKSIVDSCMIKELSCNYFV